MPCPLLNVEGLRDVIESLDHYPEELRQIHPDDFGMEEQIVLESASSPQVPHLRRIRPDWSELRS